MSRIVLSYSIKKSYPSNRPCCEALRIPLCLDNLLTDGGEVLSPTHRPHSTPQKHYFSASGTHLCMLEAE
jgi:hypothetical protein